VLFKGGWFSPFPGGARRWRDRRRLYRQGAALAGGHLRAPIAPAPYVSLAPPDTPLPWLLAAIDKQKDRLPLVGERRLCDRVVETLEAESETLRLRVPGLPGGVWTPDDFTIGGFLRGGGESAVDAEFCIVGIGVGPT